VFERYTEPARRAVFFGRYEASQFGAEQLEPEHLLLGIVRVDSQIAGRLKAAGVTGDSIRSRMKPAREKVPESLDLPVSGPLKRAMVLAGEESKRFIMPEHLLVGLVRGESSLAAQILLEAGLTAAKLREFAPAAVIDADEIRNRLTAAISIRGNESLIGSLAAYIARSSEEEIEALIAAIRGAKGLS